MSLRIVGSAARVNEIWMAVIGKEQPVTISIEPLFRRIRCMLEFDVWTCRFQRIFIPYKINTYSRKVAFKGETLRPFHDDGELGAGAGI